MLQKPIIYENLCQLKRLLQFKSDCRQKITVVFRTAIFVLLGFIVSLLKKSIVTRLTFSITGCSLCVSQCVHATDEFNVARELNI